VNSIYISFLGFISFLGEPPAPSVQPSGYPLQPRFFSIARRALHGCAEAHGRAPLREKNGASASIPLARLSLRAFAL
jgi:hypothetical protein